MVDADLSGYFDSIPHAELMKSAARRIVDRPCWIWSSGGWNRRWKKSTSGDGRHERREARTRGRGTPQGSPLSSLLANLYMRRFIKGWKELGHEKRLGAASSTMRMTS